jgi:hypothetical protein
VKANRIRWSISGFCFLLLVLHVIWPKLSLDLTSTIILVVGLIPWLAPVIKTIELPGGFKIEVQDLKAATEKIVGSEAEPIKARSANIQTIPADSEKAASFATLRQLAQEDPNLTLVGFRIELERRLNALAAKHDLVTYPKSAGQLLRVLQEKSLIPSKMASGLADLVALGNQAAHGAEVSANAARWVLDTAPEVLNELDRLIRSE